MNEQRKAIGLINDLGQGGAERQMLFLLDHKIISEIVTLYDKKFFTENEKIKPLSDTACLKFLKPFFLFWQMWRFSKMISPEDLVISFLEWSNFVNILSSFLVSHQVVVSVRTNPKMATRGMSRPKAWLMKLLYPYAHRIVTNSLGARNFLISEYKISADKIFFIPNTYDMVSISTRLHESLEPQDDTYFQNGPVCIAVGRLEKPKGYQYLISAFREVVKEISNAKLLIVGEGGQRAVLQNLVQRFDLQNNVFLIGERKNPFSLMSRAKLFVVSSLWEGMPNVIVESLVCGTPVVSVDCDFGPRDILNDQVGILTKPIFDDGGKGFDGVTEAECFLAQGILNVLQGKKTFPYFNENVEKILDQFSPDRVIEQWKTINGS